MDHYSISSLLCIQLRWCWISSTFISLLQLIRFSLVASSVLDWFIVGRLTNFTYLSGGMCAGQSFLQLIWHSYVWVMWNERNQWLFRNSECTLLQLLDKVKLCSYRWVKTMNINLVSNYHSWWSNLFTCLGIN
jgi:hypothetical protein